MAMIKAIGPYLVIKIDLDYLAKSANVQLDSKSRTVSQHGIITETKEEDFDRVVQYANRGLVVEIGPEAYTLAHHKEPWCKVGDYVLFDKYSGGTFKDEETGEWYRTVTDEQIRAVIEE